MFADLQRLTSRGRPLISLAATLLGVALAPACHPTDAAERASVDAGSIQLRDRIGELGLDPEGGVISLSLSDDRHVLLIEERLRLAGITPELNGEVYGWLWDDEPWAGPFLFRDSVTFSEDVWTSESAAEWRDELGRDLQATHKSAWHDSIELQIDGIDPLMEYRFGDAAGTCAPPCINGHVSGVKVRWP